MLKYLLLTLFFSSPILAKTTIAVFDNQINIDHPQLKENIFKNNQEIMNSFDDDQNGYIDDLLGWNFLKNRGYQFQTHESQSFPKEVFDYYELKAKKNLGTISEVEEVLLKTISRDKEVMQQKKLFTKYAHGTHIACLAMGVNYKVDNQELQSLNINILPITYLGNESEEGAHPDFYLKKFKAQNPPKLENVESYLKTYRGWLINKFNTSINYSKQFSKIINASWGQSAKSTSLFIQKIYLQEFKSEIPGELLSALTATFMNELLSEGKNLLAAHSDVLFIFSAGNTKSDNDLTPHYPSSIKLENTIAVGALHENQRASFSNFGAANVDFFYPGVAIASCTPDGEVLRINGTSQSAAQVSYIAAVVAEKLEQRSITTTPSMIKDILIKTSIPLPELKDFCLYGARISLANVLNYFN